MRGRSVIGILLLASACSRAPSQQQPAASAQPSVTAAPEASCNAAPLPPDRVPQLLAQGKLDRAARVLNEACRACPAKAPEHWAQLVTVLAQLGRIEQVESLASTIQQRADAPTEAKEAARKAIEAIAPLRTPPSDLSAARRRARELFAQGTWEPDKQKSRDLFLKAAEALPPGGPALYQAGRMAAKSDPVLAQQLFDRALSALERTTKSKPMLSLPSTSQPKGPRYDITDVGAALTGRLVTFTSGAPAAVVIDAFTWRPRFDLDGLEGIRSVLSEDGAILAMSATDTLMSCSLVEATCTSIPGKGGSLALTADGDTAAVVEGNSSIALYDAATLSLKKRLEVKGKIASMAMTPLGDRIVAGMESGKVDVLSTSTGEVQTSRHDYRSPVVDVALDFKGNRLASTDAWSIRFGPIAEAKSELLLDGSEIDRNNFTEQNKRLVVAPDGSTIFALRVCNVFVLSTTDKLQRSRLPQGIGGREDGPYDCDQGIAGLAISGDRIYVGYDETRGSKSHTGGLRQHHVLPLKLAYGPTLEKSAPLAPGLTWGDSEPDMAVVGRGSKLMVVRSDCGAHTWDLATSKYVSIAGNSACGEAVRPSADGRSLIGHGSYGEYYDLASAKELPGSFDESPEFDAAWRQAAASSGIPKEAIETVSVDRFVAWTDAKDEVHFGPRGGPYELVGKSLVLKQPRLGDMSGGYYWQLVLNPPPAISPSGKRVLLRTKDNEAKLWDAASKSFVQTILLPMISGLAFGDDATAFVASISGSVLLARDGKETAIVSPGGGALIGIASVLQGRAVAGAFSSGPVHVWSSGDGALLATLLRLPGGAAALAPDGSAELFGKVEDALDCHVGPFVFGAELCRERLINAGTLKRALAREAVEP